jgi:lysozyme
MDPIMGIDVSHHQGPAFDWDAVKANDVQFALAKATESTDYVDETYQRNARQIADHGIVPGAYHFLWGAQPGQPTNGGDQARHFIDVVGKDGGLEGKLLAFDAERIRNGPKPRYRDVAAFVETFRHIAGDHPLLFYTGGWYWNGVLPNPDLDALGLQLWNAYYTNAENDGALRTIDRTVPGQAWRPRYGGFEKATLVQFTSQAKIAGVRVDVDLFQGSLDELRALTRTPAAPHPAKALVPIEQRPNFRRGWNAGIQSALAALGAVGLPAQHPIGPAYPAGFIAAKAALAEAVREMSLGDPDL